MSSTGVRADLVGLADIEAAARRIAAVCLRTPLLRLPVDVGRGEVWVKPESLQPTGAFKLRGATNAVLALTPQQRARGVVTHSSGNHGQALASAAAAAGIPCTVVMPEGAASGKVAATRHWGADVVFVPPDQRASACAELAARTGAAIVPPFDSAEVIAGQGTVGLEIVTDLPDVDTVLVPVGGGGLISGVAVAVKALSPQVRVIGVEPELAADLADGFARGKRVEWPSSLTGRTVADGLRVTAVGELNWLHIQALVDEVVTVSEEAIRSALRRIVLEERLVCEPSGAVALAGCLEHPELLSAGPVVSVVSGGNVEPALLSQILSSPSTVVE